MPALIPVSGAASGKSLNTSEPLFSLSEIKSTQQDELFLEFKIIIYVRHTMPLREQLFSIH